MKVKVGPILVLILAASSFATGQQVKRLEGKSDDTRTRKAGEIVIEQASLTTPETGEVKFELGTIYVPENRSDPKSRIIGVGFARFRGLPSSNALPTFHLPGGPGDSYLRGLKQDNRRL